jgi:L-Ala-D/L-Glu epimerase
MDALMADRVERIDLLRLRVPLPTPYKLAFGPVTHFDTIVVQLDGDGAATGLGEATVLTGYTDETIDESWSVAQDFASKWSGGGADPVDDAIAALGRRYPFTATAFGTALEMLRGSPALRVKAATPVPLLGLLNADQPDAIGAEFERLLAAGYGTIKVKVGFDAKRDAERVRTIQGIVRGRARVRLDANQGYTAEDGIAFVRALDPTDIELFEQPCAAGDWDAHLAVARAADVPMMLDESIYDVRDIERAAELRAARYVKVKLMKFVTLARLTEAIARIRSLGMRPVLGNGVACDLGCWMEACVAARCIDNAGEMNGFLKARAGLLATPLRFENGAIVLTPGFMPGLDHDGIAPYRVASRTFSCRASLHRTTGQA